MKFSDGVLMGEIGQVQGPLLFQVLKPANSSWLPRLALVSIHILILSLSMLVFACRLLPPSFFRCLKSSCYSLFKLGPHKGY